MKQTLNLKIGQNLTMTPQLQQAIRLLQLSSVDLHQEIQELLYSNPMLEMGDENALEEPEHNDLSDQVASVEQEQNQTQDDERVDEFGDKPWDASERRLSSNGPVSDEQYNQAEELTLRAHLLWQLNLTPLSNLDIAIGEAIIDAIEPNGFLSITTEEILSGLNGEFEVGHDELIAVLHRIQRFDPPGIAARDLRDCLHVQLDLLDPDTPFISEAILIVENYLSLVGGTDVAALARRCRLSVETTEGAVELIRSLNPRPGYGVNQDLPDYIIPDVTVSKVGDEWRVLLNPENSPNLSIADSYANLASDSNFASDRSYLRDKLQEARWFIRSLESRNQTLLRVSNAIVEHQSGFFELGPVAMKPLILRDLAEELSLHESTISRATNQKYLSCPRGIFELKYFFSSQVATDGGGECSSTAIKAIIEKLIGQEDPRKPLSDNKLAVKLNEQGIMVARRTIAKYREMLGIASSSERKRLS